MQPPRVSLQLIFLLTPSGGVGRVSARLRKVTSAPPTEGAAMYELYPYSSVFISGYSSGLQGLAQKPSSSSGCSRVLRVAAPAQHWAALTVGSACSTCCHEPLARSSRPPGSACLRHEPCSAAYRRLKLPWYSPRAGSVCPRHVRCSGAYRRLQLPWRSPRAGIVFPRRAPCRTRRLEQQ